MSDGHGGRDRARWRRGGAAYPLIALAVVVTGTAVTLTACSSDSSNGRPNAPELTVSGEFMPQPVNDMAAGFLTVRNGGGKADRLTSVTSSISDRITIHETEGQRMRKVDSFPVPADGSLALERGGNHIMFERLKSRPAKGQKVVIELHFETSDPIRVELPVMDATYNPATEPDSERPEGTGKSGESPEKSGHASGGHH